MLILLYIIVAVTVIYQIVRHLFDLVKIGDANKKAVLITGCDSGFGNGLAKKCLTEGMTVFASCATEQVRKGNSRPLTSKHPKTICINPG